MVVTFLLYLLITVILFSSIYLLAAGLSPKASQGPEAISTYACGERFSIDTVLVDPTLYEYSVYFLIFDSGIVLLAFACQALEGFSLPVIGYLLVLLSSVLLLPSRIAKIKKA